MKLKNLFILTSVLLIGVSCKSNSTSSLVSSKDSSSSLENKINLSMMVPTGTPLFGISTYLSENENVNVEVVNGSDPLLSGFTSASKDVIIAPVNLGANMYSKNSKYVLFETFVWGNLFVASRNPISSFKDLENKKIAIFGTNQTPDIIMKTLAKVNNVSYEKELTDSVESSTALFKQGVVDYFVGAEPSLSKLKLSDSSLYTLDLQTEWQKITSKASYPQAGIFVNKDKASLLESELLKMKESIKNLEKDVSYTVSCALKQETLSKVGAEALTASLPNCHFGIEENQKEAIEFYFNKLIELDLGNTMGGKLPSEDFYLSL